MLGTGEDTKPQSPGVKADREGPSQGVEVVRARKRATRCYDQGQHDPASQLRGPPSPKMQQARDSEGGSGQVGPGAGVQVGGAHLRWQGWRGQSPQRRGKGGPETP